MAEPESESSKQLRAFAGELRARRENIAVPAEMRHMFQPMDVPGSGDLFGFGGNDGMVAVCLRCGAMVYPTALDRHARFHEELEKQ